MSVVQHHRLRKERAEEQTNFVNNFTQAKNLIEKQMKIGKAIKERKALIQDKKEVVEHMREQRSRDRSRDMMAVRSVLFDTGLADKSFSR